MGNSYNLKRKEYQDERRRQPSAPKPEPEGEAADIHMVRPYDNRRGVRFALPVPGTTRVQFITAERAGELAPHLLQPRAYVDKVVRRDDAPPELLDRFGNRFTLEDARKVSPEIFDERGNLMQVVLSDLDKAILELIESKDQVWTTSEIRAGVPALTPGTFTKGADRLIATGKIVRLSKGRYASKYYAGELERQRQENMGKAEPEAQGEAQPVMGDFNHGVQPVLTPSTLEVPATLLSGQANPESAFAKLGALLAPYMNAVAADPADPGTEHYQQPTHADMAEGMFATANDFADAMARKVSELNGQVKPEQAIPMYRDLARLYCSIGHGYVNLSKQDAE